MGQKLSQVGTLDSDVTDIISKQLTRIELIS